MDHRQVSSGDGLDRRVAVARLMEQCADVMVIAGLGSPGYDLFAAGDRDLNFYLWGAMGGAAAMGLGLALAQPKRPVLVLTGDGEQLMGMGALATIGVQQPRNLAVIVFDNGMYQITGAQAALTAKGVDLVAMAMGAGMTHCAWAMDEAHFEALIDASLAGTAPVFIGTRTDDQPPAGVTERDAARIRIRFMDNLKVAPRVSANR